MRREPIQIETGSKIAIVGGGPAGSFFSLYLLHYAMARGIQPEVTIYQQRDFTKLGTKGCKGCAGILSRDFLRNLGELNLTIPDEIIQSKIDHYAVHSPYTSISISNPETGSQIVSVYRGGGPRLSHCEHSISFDDWLLREAQKRGVRVENKTASGVYLEPEAKIEVAGKKLGYDFVVLASGANARAIPIVGHDYVPPETRIMAQDELYAGTAQVESRLANVAHAFLIPHSGLIFGTLVPKGPFINVSVLSGGKHPVSVRDFLDHDIVRRILPDRYQHACGCQPRALVGPARNYYTDRFVAVGDAAISRLYKDGIGSVLLTAREAARTAVYRGVSRQDFAQYYQPFVGNMNWDNRWGRLLFSINEKAKDSRVFLLAQHRLIGDEQRNVTEAQPFTKAAWGMFTGSYNYKSIARMALSPTSLLKLLAALFFDSLSVLLHKGVISPRRLHVGGRKVLILGSGFGGTYALRRLVPSLNRNENVESTMISDENFFLFSPLLHEVAMGGIETRHVAYPIRRLQWRDRFNFIQASVEKIDLIGHKVVTTMGTLSFDYLVLALGSIADMSKIHYHGERDGNVFTLKTLRDARLIRNHIISIFERASIQKDPEQRRRLLTFVVSGGGYIGVQLVTELSSFIYKSLVKFYKTIDPHDIRIILVEVEAKIVTGLHNKLSAYAIEQLQQMGIEVRLKSRVMRAGEDYVEINDGENVPTSTLIWVVGTAANPRIAELNVAKDSMGRV